MQNLEENNQQWIISHENTILPDCVQLLFEFNASPVSDETLDNIIVIRLS